MIYAVIDKDSKIVVNAIEWDGDDSQWKPPANCLCVPLDDGYGISDTYDEDKKEFVMADSRKGEFKSVPELQTAE